MISNQVTKDENISSFYNKLAGATCAFSFIRKEEARFENLTTIQTLERALQLVPAFNEYLRLKELELKRNRATFTELEKEAFTKEFVEINKAASNMLGFKGGLTNEDRNKAYI